LRSGWQDGSGYGKRGGDNILFFIDHFIKRETKVSKVNRKTTIKDFFNKNEVF
jgi:hypothetical protein